MFRTALGAVDPGRDAAVVVAELTAADDFVAAAKEKLHARIEENTERCALAKPLVVSIAAIFHLQPTQLS